MEYDTQFKKRLISLADCFAEILEQDGLTLYYSESDDILYLGDGQSQIEFHTWIQEYELI